MSANFKLTACPKSFQRDPEGVLRPAQGIFVELADSSEPPRRHGMHIHRVTLQIARALCGGNDQRLAAVTGTSMSNICIGSQIMREA